MYIYSIYCKNNEKRYIGKTRDIKKRFKHHLFKLENGSHNKKIQKDYNLYGSESFIFEILQKCETLEEMDEMEVYYIEFFGSAFNGGYNVFWRKTQSAPTKKNKKKNQTYSIHHKTLEALEEYCKRTGATKSAVVNLAIKEYYKDVIGG